MERNMVVIRHLPKQWLRGVAKDEDEDCRKVWLSLSRPETGCRSGKAVMLKVVTHAARNCICFQEGYCLQVFFQGVRLLLSAFFVITLVGIDAGGRLLTPVVINCRVTNGGGGG